MKSGIDLDQVMQACESNDCIGFCIECGSEQYGCEPDARNYKCEDCGAKKVFGAEEILMMIA